MPIYGYIVYFLTKIFKMAHLCRNTALRRTESKGEYLLKRKTKIYFSVDLILPRIYNVSS